MSSLGLTSMTTSNTDEGKAYVYYGSSSGLSTSANWTAENHQAGSQFGYSVSTAGDVNGDGYSDVIVGAPYLTTVAIIMKGERMSIVVHRVDYIDSPIMVEEK